MRLGFPVCLLTKEDLGVFPLVSSNAVLSAVAQYALLGFCYTETRGKVEEQRDKKLKEYNFMDDYIFQRRLHKYTTTCSYTVTPKSRWIYIHFLGIWTDIITAVTSKVF